jgi:tetratricopeptide (TPR) repeat protein
MAKRWKKEEITYLRRYAKKRTLLELAERFRIEADAIETKLSELELQTADGKGKLNLAEDPVVMIYEKGIKAVHAKKWDEAKRHFVKVIADSDMADLKHRGEQYLALAERESGAESDPRDPYLKAVLEHNNGNLDAVEAACKREGRLNTDERFAYLGAAVAALREDFESAIERLTVAVELNPRNLIQARQDTDFTELRELPEFAEIGG